MIGWLRGWAARHAERGRYSPIGIAFHWVMAGLILFQLGWGYHASRMAVGADKLAAYQVHSAVGLPILLLAILRLGYRIVIPGPVNDADRLGAQTLIARAIHVLFYACFFILPLSGWAMWSAESGPGPLYLAGMLPWPRLPMEMLQLETRWAILQAAVDIHIALVWTLIIVVPLHVGAALKHHFWDRHDVLVGMLPEIPDAEDPRPAATHRQREPRFRAETVSG